MRHTCTAVVTVVMTRGLTSHAHPDNVVNKCLVGSTSKFSFGCLATPPPRSLAKTCGRKNDGAHGSKKRESGQPLAIGMATDLVVSVGHKLDQSC